MSRVDKPALKCDRCGNTTESMAEMARYSKLSHAHMSGTDTWDLCPECWSGFRAFIAEASNLDTPRPVPCPHCGLRAEETP